MPRFAICIGCGARIGADVNRCPACAARRRAQAPRDTRPSTRGKTPAMLRVYRSAAWQRCRQVVLADAGHACVVCGKPATIADHVPPLLEQLDAGGTGTDPALCRALCSSCSGRADGGRRRRDGGGCATAGGSGAPGGFSRADGNSADRFFGVVA